MADDIDDTVEGLAQAGERIKEVEDYASRVRRMFSELSRDTHKLIEDVDKLSKASMAWENVIKASKKSLDDLPKTILKDLPKTILTAKEGLDDLPKTILKDLPKTILTAKEGLEEAAAEIKEVENYSSRLKNVFSGLSKDSHDLVGDIEKLSKGTLSWDNLLKASKKNIKDLPKTILTIQDLQKEMVKDASLFKKVQAETHDLLKGSFTELEKETLSILDEANASSEVRKATLEDIKDIQEGMTDDLETQFLLLQRQEKETLKIKVNLFDAAKAMETMGAAITSPAQAMDKLLAGAGGLPNKIKGASAAAGGFGNLLKTVGPKLGAIFGVGGMLALGFGAVLIPIILVWKAFKQLWEFTDKKVVPAVADLNKELGNSGQGMSQMRGQMISTGKRFELLGKSFQEGAAAVKDLASGMQTVKFSDKQLQTGLKLAEYVGLGGEQAGKLMLAFEKAGTGVGALNRGMKSGAKEATKWGVPINQVRRDMGENIDILQRFGTQNTISFSKSAAKARSYGLSIKEVNSAFGEQMDTFEGTSEAAAKLNAIFGTQINSMELMLETNPLKRMELVRKELLNQGKSWEKLSVFEKNVITQSLGVDKAQAALVLSSDKQRKALEREAKQREKAAKVNNEWERGLTNIKRTILPLAELVNQLMQSIGNLASQVLFGTSGMELMSKTGGTLQTIFSAITGAVDTVTKKLKGKDGFSPILGDISGLMDDVVKSIKGFDIKEFIDKVIKGFGSLSTFFKELDIERINEIVETLDNLVGVVGAAIAPFTALAKLGEVMGKGFGELFFGDSDSQSDIRQLIKFHEQGRDDLVRAFETDSKESADMKKMILSGKYVDKSEIPGRGVIPMGHQKDALITKKGEVIGFDPGDNILATKSPVHKTPTGAMATAGSPPTASSQPQIIHVNLHLDGKKLAEAQVRTSSS